MHKKELYNILLAALLFSIGIMLVLKQEAVSAAVIESLKSCVYRIIPSLFAMTVVSTAISRSGVITYVLRKSKLDANIFTAFLFGNIGGYPIGAKLISEMVDDGSLSPDRAARAMCFSYGSGPAFAAGVAGIAIFGDIRFGLAALAAGFAANLTLYIIFLISDRKRSYSNTLTVEGFSTKLMIDSVNSATTAMTGICSMIVFFSALKAVMESTLPQFSNMKYFPSMLEISNIAYLSVRQGVSLVIVAMLLSFGGICVQMQLLSIIRGSFSIKLFYLTRLVVLPLSGIYAYFLERIMYSLGIVCAAATKIRLSQSSSLIPIVCVAAMVYIAISEKSKRAD